MLEFLKGKKAYIVSIVLGIAWALVQAGVITPDMYGKLEGLLIALGLAALRAGITKSGPTT